MIQIRPRRSSQPTDEHLISHLKTTFKALRNVSLDPWRISAITAAALVILHTDHARTT